MDFMEEESTQRSNPGEIADHLTDTEVTVNVPEPRFMLRSTPQKAHEYDFVAARIHQIGPNAMCESIAHMIKVFLAGGVFAMHVAVSRIGVMAGVIGLAFIALVVGITLCSLVTSAQMMYGRLQLSRLSYPDLAEATFLLSPWPALRKLAKCFRYTLEFTLMCDLLCTCAVLQNIIARALKQMMDGTIEDLYNNDFETQKMYILGMIPPCLLVVMVRHLKNLAPFAVVIDLYAIMTALVTVYYGVHGNVSLELTPRVRSIHGMFQFVGICLFSLQAISVCLVIENNMNHPQHFHYVVLGSLPYATTIMAIIGVFGYWSFGDKVVAPITVHFPWTHFPIMTKVFLCIVIYITYAEVFYFGFDIQWFYLRRFYDVPSWWFWERLYRAANVIVIALIAYFCPNISRTIGLLGCFFASPICLIIPAFIELVVIWEYPGKGLFHWRILKFLVITFVGLIIFVAGTYYNLKTFNLSMNMSKLRKWIHISDWI